MSSSKKIPIGISGRHAHLSEKHLEILFGEGYKLTVFKQLSQPGQFAAEEKIDIISADKKVLAGIRVLGPVRNLTQIEISQSDAIRYKFVAPVRSSGDIKGSGGCVIVGPKGSIEIKEGVIIADRHIHFSPQDAIEFGIEDKDVVSLKIGGPKGGIVDHVLCRVGPNFVLDAHLDTDDGAAFILKNGDTAELVKEYKIIK